MDFFPSFPISTTASIFTFIVFLYYLFFWIPKYSKRKNAQNKIAPKVGGAWPIIGHIHLLGGPKPPHITLGSFADKYGPIFSIRLGVNQALVVSDSKMAKECLTTNDKVFATRPKTLVGEVMGYNYAIIGFGAYGNYWRQIRKIMVLEFLSSRSLQKHALIRVSEIKLCINEVYEFWVKNKNASNMVKMEMKECFGNLILNVVVRLLVGKRYSPLDEEGVNFQKAMKIFLDLMGTFMVSDAVPFLRWLDLGGYEKLMRKTAKEMDDILEDWLKEHKTKRNSGLLKGEEQNFMDAMLAHVDGGSAEDFSGFDGDTVIKATCLVSLLGIDIYFHDNFIISSLT